MGARQRAQRRPNKSESKKSAWKTSLQASSLDPFAQSQGLKAWQDYSSSPQPVRHGFSLSQEARNTERRGNWALSSRLRDNKVAFVSAGNLQRDEEPEGKNREDPTGTNEVQQQKVCPKQTTSSTEIHVQQAQVENTLDAQVSRLDIVGGSTDSEHSSAHDRKTSVSSAQSDEIIVFAGRSGSKTPGETVSRRPTPSPRIQTPSGSTMMFADAESQSVFRSTQDNFSTTENTVHSRFRPEIIRKGGGRDRLIHLRQEETEDEEILRPRSQPLSQLVQEQVHDASEKATQPPSRIIRKSGGRDRRVHRRQQEIEDEETLMQDYIDNMVANEDDEDEDSDEKDDTDSSPKKLGRGNEHFRFNNGAGEENIKIRTTVSRKKRKAELDMLVWDSDDLQDFDSLSTTDEEVAEISQVLRERSRPTGMQYLVTAVGKSTGDAKWVLGEKLKSSSAREELHIWREIRAIERNDGDDSSDSTSDSEEEEALEDLVDKIESEDDENARILERTSRMTDEQIARALAKQEELGLGGDEVMLFDGQDQDEFEPGDEFISFSTKSHTSNRTRAKRNRRTKDNFPSASAFADALDEDPYGAFDVMDFDRPSLKPKHKGRKADLPFELEEDDEWKEQIEQMWSNDRNKKATKKREREELRRAGLLKSKTNDGRVDLQAKYANSGMDADQVKAEIRAFLVEDFETLSLGSMDAAMRASVHHLARALSLKSRSQGAADNRHPILTRTPHTPHYTVDTIWEIDALLAQRRYSPRQGGGWGSQKVPKGSAKIRRGGGGSNLAGASYMDGEVVGAAAPEIGAENRGRAMLEKMGWSSGMGIGALGNEGSIDVIKHVVKNTKAGLG